MKILSIEHVTRADLVEDDFYVPGHQLLENIEANVKTGMLALAICTKAPDTVADVEVTRLNIERRNRTHGLRSTYGAGCRCSTCTSAQRDYMRSYSADRRAAARELREKVPA